MNQEDMLNNVAMQQQQLQGIMTQREATGLQIMELKKALEELGKTKEKEVYKVAGPILVKAGKTEVVKDLKEKEDSLNVRLKMLEKEEKRIKISIDDIKEQLTAALKKERK
jgi:prefoldin beta subunit